MSKFDELHERVAHKGSLIQKAFGIEIEKGDKLKSPVKEGDFQLDKGHTPFMKVAKGGSNCGNCKFSNPKEGTCGNEYFIKWSGSNKLPQPLTDYCSDWYEPKIKK